MGVDNPSKPRNCKTSRNKRSAQGPKQQSFSQTLSPLRELSWFAAIAVCLKLLLIPSYRSTDFEVHRNWLAITSSLPLPQWYSDDTSPWTLDYPPLFAYFELFLSFFATVVDPTITDLHRGLDYAADSVVYFQRLTVMFADLGLLWGVYLFVKRLELGRRPLLLFLIVLSPALLIVDHIHFQYNGFLIGVLLISLAFLEEGRDLAGGFVFALLLCLKHLFAVAAPLYFVYLLRHYCRGGFRRAVGRLLAVGAVVGAVFGVAFGPFVYYGQGRYIGYLGLLLFVFCAYFLVWRLLLLIPWGQLFCMRSIRISYSSSLVKQVLSRMFPFGRGLCHAYWAPNFWVFYIILDKALSFLLRKLGFDIKAPSASFTSGLVGNSSPFSVLPQVTPIVTFLLVLLSMAPCLVKAWKEPRPSHLTRWVAYTYTCGFLFGWHVHEKASLHFVIPLAIVATYSLEDARHYFLLSIVSCYSIFPLLFEPKEYPIKVLLLVTHAVLMWLGFSRQFSKGVIQRVNSKDSVEREGSSLIGWVEVIYLLGMMGIEIWGQFLHPYFFHDKLPFLPLMLVSIYCAMGMIYSWIWQLTRIIRSD